MRGKRCVCGGGASRQPQTACVHLRARLRGDSSSVTAIAAHQESCTVSLIKRNMMSALGFIRVTAGLQSECTVKWIDIYIYIYIFTILSSTAELASFSAGSCNLMVIYLVLMFKRKLFTKIWEKYMLFLI